MSEKEVIETVSKKILVIRGVRVMLDADLAQLYGVTTGAFNQAIKRNIKRFPKDFLFQLTEEERKKDITNCDILKNIKYSRVLPYAFTEHGAIMAASVLNSQKAIEVSVYVVRAFIAMRAMLAQHHELAKKLAQLENTVDVHSTHIRSLFNAIRQLMAPPEQLKEKKPIGFIWK